MTLTWLKAIHIVFIVSWFAALFYIVRLFIYTAEAQRREDHARKVLTDQLLLMQRRLWNIIGWPAMAGTVLTGAWMFMLNYDYFISQRWMQLKLAAVLVLLWYHFACQRILNRQADGIFTWTSIRLRLFNELATVLLVAIVFLVVLKTTSGLVYGVGGLLVFGIVLTLAVFLYRKARRGE